VSELLRVRVELVEAFTRTESILASGENFGIAVVEALASGLAVVISDRVNVSPEVRAAGAGLVTACNAKETALAICDVLSDAGLSGRMGDAGSKMASSTYDWAQAIPRLVDVYEMLLRQRDPKSAVLQSAIPSVKA